MLVVLCASKEEQAAFDRAKLLTEQVDQMAVNFKEAGKGRIFVVGPADAAVSKVNDIYKKVIYIRAKEYETLVTIKDGIERFTGANAEFKNTIVQFDFNPMNQF